MYAQFEKEDRLLEGKSRFQFGWSHAVFRPKLMAPGELEQGVQHAYDSLHGHFRKRLARALLKRWMMLVKNPRLLGVLVAGTLRRASVRKEPE